MRPPIERFMDKVEKTDTCWLWIGVSGGSNARYGYFQESTRTEDGKVSAHRFAYKHFVGPIPEGMELDHVKLRGCTSTLCVNPDHLEPVTHSENRKRSRLEVCRSGRHDLSDPDNLRWDDKGQRRGCLICHRDKARARYHRMKEKKSVTM